jgi:hypothetical protein
MFLMYIVYLHGKYKSVLYRRRRRRRRVGRLHKRGTRLQ